MQTVFKQNFETKLKTALEGPMKILDTRVFLKRAETESTKNFRPKQSMGLCNKRFTYLLTYLLT